MYRVTLKIESRTFVPKTVKEQKFEDWGVVEGEVNTKLGLFRALMREFGRCTGSIPMGYLFERTEEHGGETSWWEYRVTVIGGAVPVSGFNLVQ